MRTKIYAHKKIRVPCHPCVTEQLVRGNQPPPRQTDVQISQDDQGDGHGAARANHTATKSKIAYCRVSSPNQRRDLERQVDAMRSSFPEHRVVTDIGSGINFKRRGLLSVLDAVVRGDVEEVVVAHRDRLCRFAFDLVKWIMHKHGFASERLECRTGFRFLE